MPKPKTVLVLNVDRSIHALPAPPTWQRMQAIVGGTVEQVRVLDRIEAGQPIYSFLYVNEDGLTLGLPRNDQATQVYQRSVRMAYGNHPQPFLAAKAHARQLAALMGGVQIDLTPSREQAAYELDPWIAGPAIYFEGWSAEEVTAYWNREDD
jgi:hypothetical protein